MERFKTLVTLVVLMVAILVLFNKLFTTQPIQIILETGQEVTTESADYFSLQDVLISIIASFLIGTISVYLYYSDESKRIIESFKKKDIAHEAILPFLKGEEKDVFLLIKKNNNELLQNKIVKNTGLSKVKIARLISRLERKRLVKKERYGLTNKIVILQKS